MLHKGVRKVRRKRDPYTSANNFSTRGRCWNSDFQKYLDAIKCCVHDCGRARVTANDSKFNVKMNKETTKVMLSC